MVFSRTPQRRFIVPRLIPKIVSSRFYSPSPSTLFPSPSLLLSLSTFPSLIITLINGGFYLPLQRRKFRAAHHPADCRCSRKLNYLVQNDASIKRQSRVNLGDVVSMSFSFSTNRQMPTVYRVDRRENTPVRRTMKHLSLEATAVQESKHTQVWLPLSPPRPSSFFCFSSRSSSFHPTQLSRTFSRAGPRARADGSD